MQAAEPAGRAEGGERARFRWHEVSLVCDLAEAQHERRRAVVASLSASGAFVRTELSLAPGTRVRLELSLGTKIGRVRCQGRVAEPDARAAASSAPGFQVRFDQPQLDLVERLEQLHQRSGQPVRLDAEGRIRWPIADGGGRPAPEASASGLQVWSGKSWARISPAPGSRVAGLRDEPSRLALLRRSLAVLRGSSEPGAALAYRGALLTGGAGAPCDEVCKALRAEPPEASVWLAPVDVALRVVHFLDGIGWRLEALDATHRELIEHLRGAVLATRSNVRAELDRARGRGDRERAALAEGLAAGLGELDVFLDCLLVSVECPEDLDRDAAEGWDRLPSAGELGEGKAGAASGKRTLMVAAALLAVVLGGMGFSASWLLRPDPGRTIVPIDPNELSTTLPVESLATEGHRAVIGVPSSWSGLPVETRRVALLAAFEKLGNRHYTEALVRDADGRELARWHDSQLDIR